MGLMCSLISMTGEMMISTIYGEQDADRCKQYIHNAEEAISGLLIAGNFGKFLVDTVPACQCYVALPNINIDFLAQ